VAPASTRTAQPARPTRRGGPQLPLWGNLLVGFLILGAGLYFSLASKGQSIALKAGLLVLYAALAGLYFGRAYRQYRRR
jgi:hypothetical protein